MYVTKVVLISHFEKKFVVLRTSKFINSLWNYHTTDWKLLSSISLLSVEVYELNLLYKGFWYLRVLFNENQNIRRGIRIFLFHCETPPDPQDLLPQSSCSLPVRGIRPRKSCKNETTPERDNPILIRDWQEGKTSSRRREEGGSVPRFHWSR